MDLELNGRVAVVTGTSIGIGREIAKTFAAEGMRLVLVARRGQLLRELQQEIAATGMPPPLAIAKDVTAANAHLEIRDEVLAACGHVDILVNNAGGSRPLPVDAPEEAWEEAIALNFTAVRRLTHAFLPTMSERRWGRIINITGTSEPRGLNAAYAAKAAVYAWAKGLSREIGQFGITINSLAPGRILSEQIVNRINPGDANRDQFARDNIPLGYFGEPRDMAYAAAFLASPKARYITGEILAIDGGMRRYAF
jgi:3-oxoacyl-[acyl-carrier protein] reductase